MNNYLQRLLDRAAPTPSAATGVLPAGLSQSPISLSDQRTNDPDFADRYNPLSESRESFSELASEAPRGVSRRQRPRPDFNTLETESRPTETESAPPQINSPTPQPPTSTVEPPSITHPRPTGFVDATDLVLPEPEVASEPEPAMRPVSNNKPENTHSEPDKTIEALEPDTPTDDPRPHRRTENEPDESTPEITELTTSPSQPVTELPPPVIEADPTPRSEPILSAVETETRQPTEVIPPPLEIPSLPDIAKPAAHQTQSEPSPAPVVQAVPEPSADNAAMETRSNRPMTAASASIIGELTPRRRALTLFGLRRR